MRGLLVWQRRPFPRLRQGLPCLINYWCPQQLARTHSSRNTPNSLHRPGPRSSPTQLQVTSQRSACVTHLLVLK